MQCHGGRWKRARKPCLASREVRRWAWSGRRWQRLPPLQQLQLTPMMSLPWRRQRRREAPLETVTARKCKGRHDLVSLLATGGLYKENAGCPNSSLGFAGRVRTALINMVWHYMVAWEPRKLAAAYT